jgi:hypothetical protein
VCALTLFLASLFTSLNTEHTTTTWLQQDHDIGETETDVLKQMGVVVDRVRTVCANYKQLTTSAAAAKSNIVPLSGNGVSERLKPVSEQQQLQLQDAVKKLKSAEGKELLPLRVHELAAVRRVVTEAISGNTTRWCQEHTKPVPISIYVFLSSIKHPAGLYGEVLQRLKHEVSEVAVEAKKQLEAVVFNTNHSSSSSGVRMIILKLDHLDSMAASYTKQLQQLYKWAHTAGAKLILISASRYDVTQTLPGLQQAGILPVQVVFNPFTDNVVVAILSARVGSVVPAAALELCAQSTLVVI